MGSDFYFLGHSTGAGTIVFFFHYTLENGVLEYTGEYALIMLDRILKPGYPIGTNYNPMISIDASSMDFDGQYAFQKDGLYYYPISFSGTETNSSSTYAYTYLLGFSANLRQFFNDPMHQVNLTSGRNTGITAMFPTSNGDFVLFDTVVYARYLSPDYRVEVPWYPANAVVLDDGAVGDTVRFQFLTI